MLKWPFQRRSHLQLGDQKVTLNDLVEIAVISDDFELVVFRQPIWKISANQIGSWNPEDRGEKNKIFENTTITLPKNLNLVLIQVTWSSNNQNPHVTYPFLALSFWPFPHLCWENIPKGALKFGSSLAGGSHERAGDHLPVLNPRNSRCFSSPKSR